MTEPTISGFFSGGAKSFSWKDKPIGTAIQGTIKAVHPPQPQTDPGTKEIQLSKRTGKPKMQVRITLATDERDPQDPDDDGTRDLYVGGWMQGAVGEALRQAGAPNNEPQVGGKLWVQLTEREPNPPLNPINKFVAGYQLAPVTGQFFNGQAQQVPAQPQFQQPSFAPPMAPAPLVVPTFQSPGPAPSFAPPAQSPGPIANMPAQFADNAAALQQAIPTEPAPQRPNEISEAAWKQMPLDTQKALAAAMSGAPGATLVNEPPY